MDPASTLENPIVVAGLLTQAVGAGVLAVLLQRFHRQLGRGYLRDWALAWVAMTPTGLVDGKPAFEYVWTGPIHSGSYYAVIHGKAGGQEIRTRARVTVAR